MQRWQEEWERKQAEFMRCIRSFGKMSEVWTALSMSSISEGHASYARKKSAMFLRMKRVAQAKFDSAGYTNRVLQEGQILADLIQEDRRKMEQLNDSLSGWVVLWLGFLYQLLTTLRTRQSSTAAPFSYFPSSSSTTSESCTHHLIPDLCTSLISLQLPKVDQDQRFNHV